MEELYNTIKGLKGTAKQDYIKTLPTEKYQEYLKYARKVSYTKYNQNPDNIQRFGMERRDNLQRLRTEQKQRYKELNRRQQQDHRERIKQNKQENTKVVKGILDDVIDKVVVKAKKTEDNKNMVKSILNDIIDTIPENVRLKRNKEAVARYRLREKGQQVEMRKVGRPKKQ